MLSVLLRRFPRCYQSNHLIGADIQRLSRRNLSTISPEIKQRRKQITELVEARTMCYAHSAREAAQQIVARLPEKEIKLVIRSFECAANRPNRITRLITRNSIDVTWMNKWFAALNDDINTPLFPFPVPIPLGFEEAKIAMFEAITNANKFKNTDFFINIARRKSSTDPPITVNDDVNSNAEIQQYVDEGLMSVPPLISMQLAQIINEYSAEQLSVVSLKRSLRKVSGIHAYALPQLFHLLDLPFNSPNLITDGNIALEGYVVALTKNIVACNAVTLLRRSRNVNKLIKKKTVDDIDPLSEAYLVSGSNPSTKEMLTDLEVDTELSIMMKGKVPARTVELRRRTLKTEHCLQITLECQTEDRGRQDDHILHENFERRGGPDFSGGYDDFSSPPPAAGLSAAYDWQEQTDVNWQNLAESQKREKEKPVKLHVSDAEWCNSPYKIFIDNIAPDVSDSDLINALRLCGTAKSVRFMKTSSGGILSSPPPLLMERPPLTADKLYEKFGIRTDARPRMCMNGLLRNVVLPKNPLAVITSVKRRAIKKTIAQVQRNDSCAFAVMNDQESYLRMTERDDVRIFGICVAGQNCRVKSSRKLTTIYLETRACISAQNVKSFLAVSLGVDHQFTVTDYWANNGGRIGDSLRYPEKTILPADLNFLNEKVMPVFVVLKFKTHTLAWEAYVKLSSSIEDGAPFKLSWTRTSWYFNVKAKAKEMHLINQILLEDAEHSEGYSASDYLASLEEDDEDEYDEFDEHEPIVKSVKEDRPFQAINQHTDTKEVAPVEVVPVIVAPVKVAPKQVIVRKKRRTPQEMLEAKEQKIAEKAEKALQVSQKAASTAIANTTKTFTFPVLHDPVRVREHFYDSDGDIITAKADKLRGY